MHPEDVATMRRKARRYGAGQRWLDRRYPGVPRAPGLTRELVRGAAGTALWTVTAQFERASYKALDVVWISAYTRGWNHGDNAAIPLNSA
jgi:hypothetical protein